MSGFTPRRLKKGEEDAFLELMYTAFGFEAHFARYLEFDDALGVEDTWVIESGRRIVSGAQIFTRPIRIAREPLFLGGIGSVATHPDHQGQGLATRVLREAIRDMEGRGMALSLLFTARTSFYERLDWVEVPYRVLVCREPRPFDDLGIRTARMNDLPRLMDLYAGYTEELDGVTRRDKAYWEGQLRFAGNPGEGFRVIEREGEPVAYARSILLEGRTRVTEFARAEGAAGELSRLLAAMTPAREALFVPDAHDPDLLAACRAQFSDCQTIELQDQMWRILDRGRLSALVDGASDLTSGELLARIVGADRGLFWPSDRF